MPSTGDVYFFESQQAIEGLRPYATLQEEELTRLIRRFVAWAAILATHPRLAESFGDASTAHITLATDLRMAIKKSQRENSYPNLVLPTHKYMAAMTLMRQSRALEPTLAEALAGEHRRWDTDYSL